VGGVRAPRDRLRSDRRAPGTVSSDLPALLGTATGTVTTSGTEQAKSWTCPWIGIRGGTSWLRASLPTGQAREMTGRRQRRTSSSGTTRAPIRASEHVAAGGASHRRSPGGDWSSGTPATNEQPMPGPIQLSRWLNERRVGSRRRRRHARHRQARNARQWRTVRASCPHTFTEMSAPGRTYSAAAEPGTMARHRTSRRLRLGWDTKTSGGAVPSTTQIVSWPVFDQRAWVPESAEAPACRAGLVEERASVVRRTVVLAEETEGSERWTSG
jgi:hypothetical protein